MKLSKILTFGALGAALVFGTAYAAGHIDPAIKARKAVMQLYAYNLGQLGAMAKGDVEYDADAAAAAAGNLQALANLDQSTLWPEGSDNSANENTRALPALWTDFDMALVNDFGAAVEAMNAAAGTDLAGLQAAIGPLGGACGACHKAYRAPAN